MIPLLILFMLISNVCWADENYPKGNFGIGTALPEHYIDFNENGKEIGYIDIVKGKMFFHGDFDKSMRLFLNSCKESK